MAGGVGTTGALAIGFSTHMVDFVSVEMGLRLMDLLTSFAQLSGMGIQFVELSSTGCVSVHSFLMVSSLFIPHFSRLSHVVIFAAPNVGLSCQSGISAGGFAMVSGLVFHVLSSSLVLTFTFRSSSIPSTSLGNGILSSFGHSCSRHQVFSSTCSNVTVTGLHQSTVVAGGWTDSGCAEGFVSTGSGLVVDVDES